MRVRPDQVFVTDPADIQQIHRIKGGFLKGVVYEKLAPGIINVFNTRNVDVHRRFRKLLSGPMAEASLQSMLPQIDAKVRLAIQRMGEEMYTRGGVVDINKWWMFMTTDVIGELSFGESFRMLEYGEVSAPNCTQLLTC